MLPNNFHIPYQKKKRLFQMQIQTPNNTDLIILYYLDMNPSRSYKYFQHQPGFTITHYTINAFVGVSSITGCIAHHVWCFVLCPEWVMTLTPSLLAQRPSGKLFLMMSLDGMKNSIMSSCSRSAFGVDAWRALHFLVLLLMWNNSKQHIELLKTSNPMNNQRAFSPLE